MLIFLWGADTWRSRKRLGQLRSRYLEIAPRAPHEKWWEGKEANLGELQEELAAPSLFQDRRFFVLRNVLSHTGLLPFLKARIAVLQADDPIVVVWEEEVSQTSPAFQFLASYAKLHEDFPLLEGKKLERELQRIAAARGASLSPKASVLLREELGSDLWRAEQEICKLSSFVLPSRIIEEDHVRKLISPSSEARAFDVLDAIAAKKTKEALRLLKSLELAGTVPLVFLSMLLSQFRNLLVLKELEMRGLTPASIAQKSGVHPFVLRKLSPALSSLTLVRLKEHYRHLLELERAMKIGATEGFRSFERFIFLLSGGRP
ncbi:DNA polymerase III subunit delta [Patescibacteria group bacterium]|nr:DNA polymerase III subunit delta [Patescibacteria group bacterium]